MGAFIARCGAVGLALGVGGLALSGPSCTKLEDPCSVSDKVVVAVVAQASRFQQPEFVRTDGALAAMFFESGSGPNVPTDAGTIDALGGLGGALIPTTLHVVVLDDLAQSERTRESFHVPSRLGSRKGSTEAFGVAWGRGRALFHWVETTTTTAADGSLSKAAKLVLQSVDAAGVEGLVIEPAEARCDDCSIQVDAVDFAGTRLVVFGTSAPTTGSPLHDAQALGLGSAGTTKLSAFAVGPAGEILPRNVPAVIGSQPTGFPRFDVLDGVLVLVNRAVVPVDTALNVIGSILTLPRLNPLGGVFASVDFAGDSFVAEVSPRQSGGNAANSTDTPDLLVQRYDRSGRPAAPVARLGRTSSIRDVARSDDLLLVLHQGDARYLSVARIPTESAAAPVKIGGDVDFDPTPSSTDKVFGLAGGSFRALSLTENQVTRREVTCGK